MIKGESDRLSRVERLLEVQQRQIDELTAENRRLRSRTEPEENGPLRSRAEPEENRPLRSRTEPEAEVPDGEADARTVGRRRLLLGGAVAGAAAVAGVLATGQPAAAADDDPLVLGFDANESSSLTKLNYFGTDGVAFEVDTRSGNGDAIVGQSSSLAGVVGVSGTSYGVYGESNANGVTGLSTGDGNGVYGQASVTGVAGVSTSGSGSGTTGFSFGGGTGVDAVSQTGVGLNATSDTGTGLTVEGRTTLRLISQAGRSAPTTDAVGHVLGDVVIDATGAIWLCTAAGTPGTWRKIGGPSTAGQFHVLPAPARIYDSRPNTVPSQGPKTTLSGNVARPIDCTHNNSGVPIGATAVSLTVLLVNAANGNGNMTIWANGAPRPAANTAVWGTGSGRYTTTAICALDATARIQVAASASTDVVLDVVGYYR